MQKIQTMNYNIILSEFVGVPASGTNITTKHLQALLTMTQEDLDRVFGFRTIRMLTDNFVAKAKGKNITLYYENKYGVDADIFNWLPNTEVIDGEQPSTNISMLEQTTTEADMLKTAIKLPLSQAIERMTSELEAGYFDEKNKILIIYLTDQKDGISLRLVGIRDSVGELGLDAGKVGADYEWDVKDLRVGFLSSNAS